MTNCSILGIIVDAEIKFEKSYHGGWIEIVMQTQSCIYKDETLISFNKQTSAADMPWGKPGRHGRAIKDENWHGNILMMTCSARSETSTQ